VRRELRYSGWKVSVIWQCQLKDITRLKGRLLEFLQE
jgi:G:T-mismatch repair DNA endonuclease (very short patch repair protein)